MGGVCYTENPVKQAWWQRPVSPTTQEVEAEEAKVQGQPQLDRLTDHLAYSSACLENAN